jgi:hypothetical protein
MNISVKYGRLNTCISLGYLALVANKFQGRRLFSAFVSQAPFLGDSYFTYPHGFISYL